MLQTNPPQDTKVKEIDIIAGIKLVETEYQVRVPVFVDTPVDKPVFKDKEIEIPVGWDKVIDKVAERIVSGIMDNITLVIGARLDAAIDSRIKEIKYPKLIEEVNITTKEITVEKPIYVDVEVKVPVFQEYVIANPVLKNVEVINAVIADKTVINAVITDMQITNAIIKDIEVERAIIREKVIDVIHPRYLKINGDLDE